MNVLMATGELSSNSLGRAYCLWLVARELGWRVKVIGVGRIWAPLAETDFARDCVPMGELQRWQGWSDVVVAYQPLPETLGAFSRADGPVVIDIDEPHWEGRYGFDAVTRTKVTARRALSLKNPLLPFWLRRRTKDDVTLVSNPALLDLYPGSTLVPHVRPSRPLHPLPTGRTRIAFVGTYRAHKGVELLRAAAADAPVDLILTMDPPSNARPNETWLGTTSLERGNEVLRSCHAAAVLSSPGPFSSRQLPVKAIDAMMNGRVVLGSRTPPLIWALDGTGLLVDLDQESVAAALIRLTDPEFCKEAARRTYVQASTRFTPEAVAPALAAALTRAVEAYQG